MEQPTLDRIRLYPIKALDFVELETATIGVHSLQRDRSFAMVAADGRYINGKRTGRVNQLKARYELEQGLVFLSDRKEGQETRFELNAHNQELSAYLSDFFGMGVTLVASNKGELMDVPTTSSVTVISQSSIVSLQDQLPDLSLEDLRLRFRCNLELTGVKAFWEEQLFQQPGTGVRFTIGEVEMIGIGPRDRCNVPPRDPHTGETNKQFVKQMMESRKNSLPPNSHLLQHGNLYHLSADTYIPKTEQGKTIRKGDPIEIIGPVEVQQK